LANNGAQLAVGRFLIFGAGTRYLAPVLLTAGTVTGVVLGLFAERFARESEWYRGLTQGTGNEQGAFPAGTAAPVECEPGAFDPQQAGSSGGVKRGILPALTVTVTVVFFALLVPNGKVLCTLGPLAVTEGALTAGLRRGAILVGTVILSRIILAHTSLKKNNSLISLIFTYYGRITSQKVTFEKGHFIKTLDRILLPGGISGKG
jgi:hypothetical protein